MSEERESRAPFDSKALAKDVSSKLIGPRATASLVARRRRMIDGALGLTTQGKRSKQLLRSTRDRHSGETCVIIGNGPSLNDTPLHLLKDVPTFGLNRIYLMYDRLGFEATYHVVVNSYVVAQRSNDFSEIQAPLFTTWKNRASLTERAHPTCFLPTTSFPSFSRNLLTDSIWEGATVTYVAMQVAYHLGFSKVVLVGVDHRFVDDGPAHKLVESSGPDRNHFDPNYFGPGFKWQLPDLETSELAYSLARDTYENNGRQIVDATVGGALQVFPKADLVDALA